MKKNIVLGLIISLIIVTSVYAVPPVVPGAGNTITLRDAVTANDSLTTINAETMTLGEFGKVKLIMTLGIGSTSFDVTPACKEGDEWYSGDTSTVTRNSWMTVNMTGCTTFSVWIDNESGTSELTIKARDYSDQ